MWVFIVYEFAFEVIEFFSEGDVLVYKLFYFLAVLACSGCLAGHRFSAIGVCGKGIYSYL